MQQIKWSFSDQQQCELHIYRITCQKPQCKTFVYIGQTKCWFCDRISEHREYVSQKKLDQMCDNHFDKSGHSQNDMLPIILEKVTLRNDEFLRLKREEFWIRTYQTVEFGNNKKTWNFNHKLYILLQTRNFHKFSSVKEHVTNIHQIDIIFKKFNLTRHVENNHEF